MSSSPRRARSIDVFVCPDCEAVHIDLYARAGDTPFASIVIAPEEWERVVQDVAAQRLVVRADDPVGKPVGRA